MVEQRFCKAKVVGPNPTGGLSKILKIKQIYVPGQHDQARVHGLQESQLFFPEEQEAFEGQIGNEEILQALQKTHSAQRDEVRTPGASRGGVV